MSAAGLAVEAERPARKAGLTLLMDIVVAAALVIQLAVTILAAISREVSVFNILWADETAKISLSVIAYLGGAAAYRLSEHASVEIVVSRFSPRVRGFLANFVDVVILLTSIYVFLGTLELARVRMDEFMPITDFPTVLISAEN